MSDKSVFTEKQYLGREFIPLTIRLVLAMFCFAAYFFTDERERNGDLLVVVGFAIIIISIIMGFLLHFRTRVENKSVMLDGLWTTKLVKIDLNSIIKVEKGTYSRYLFNNPVYNLHTKGTIRFFTSGNEAIHLTDRDGLLYIIGSKHPNEFLRAVKEEMKK
jgi:heme/copper-type cytochrome/quinol oxidase subunit 4